MYPAKNGVRSAAFYFARGDDRPLDLLPDHCFSHTLVRLGVLRDQPTSSDALRARPLWAILSDYGLSSGIVRWPLTYPAQAITGFLITDRFHQQIGSMFEFDGRAAYPAEILPPALDAFAGSTGAGPWDEFYARAARDVIAQHPVQLEAVRYQGVDAAGHYYLRYALPRAFGDAPDEGRQQYGAVLDRAYAAVDGAIGAAIERQTPGDLLLVISGFGMQPVTAIKHLAARLLRDPDVSGTHEGAPDGFLLAYGAAVAPGRKQRGSIVDVTPTILYFLGVPIGRDMDGYARADLFTREFTAERPITFIPSHGR
jgi:predicted AlkP superfamily phosphohydrolase/phosphomutase